MSKLYTGKAHFRQSTFGLLNPILTKPITMNVRNIVGGGDQPWAVAELTADSVCKNGMAYDQTYSWVCRSVLLPSYSTTTYSFELHKPETRI